MGLMINFSFYFVCMKSIFFFFVLLFASLSSSVAQKTSDWINKDALQNKNFVDTIEFETIVNKIFIKIKIDSVERKFIFDTGAPCMIKDDILSLISHKFGEKRNLEYVNGRVYEHSFITLDSLRIGKTKFINVPAFDIKNENLDELFRCLDFDGIIGSNILNGLLVKIDYQKKHIILSDRSEAFLKRSKSGDLSISPHGKPFIDIKISTKIKDKVLFDSGDDGFYSISDNLVSKYGKSKFQLSDYLIDTIKISDSQSISKFLFRDLKFSNVNFKDVVTITTSQSNSRIGSELLKYGSIILNFKDKEFIYEPYDLNAKEIHLPQAIRDFSISLENGVMKISQVWPNSNSRKMGIKEGDQLLELNGNKIESPCNFFLSDGLKANSEKIVIKIKNQEGVIKDYFFQKNSVSNN